MSVPNLKAIKDWCINKFAVITHSHGSVQTITFATEEPSEVAEGEIVLVYEE